MDGTITPTPDSRNAGYRVERYGPNESVPVFTGSGGVGATSMVASIAPMVLSGDFILTHSSGLYGKIIRFGETLRYWGKDKVFAHWSHAAIFVNDTGDIVEALGGGVQKRNISVYHGTEYVVVHLPITTTTLDRQQAVKFAEFSLNDPYGWLTIVSMGLCLLTGAKFGFGVDGQQICSALVARCIERIGEVFPEGDPWHLSPADLAKHFDVQLTGDKGQVPNPKVGVSRFSKPGRRRQ